MTKNRPQKRKKKRAGRKPGVKVIHGGYSLLTTGALPEKRRYLAHYLTGVREGLIKDLGPTEADLTTAQKVLIDRVVTYLGIVRLIEEHVRELGIFQNSQGFLNPALAQNYLAYCGHISRALQILGVEKRTVDDVLDIQAYVKAFDEAKAKEAAKVEPQGQTAKAEEGKGKGKAAVQGQVDRVADQGDGQGMDQEVKEVDARRATSGDIPRPEGGEGGSPEGNGGET